MKRVVSLAGDALGGFLALLLFASLLLIAGCGAEEESSPPEEDEPTTTAPAETTQATTTAETTQATTTASTIGPDEVIQAFQNAGLEVGETYPVEAEPGWYETLVPKRYAQAVRFRIPSLGGDAGGRVFVFDSEGDLVATRNYYESLNPPVLPYVYVKDQVLLQITTDLPKAEADRYGAVLQEGV
ncbi:MAG TPA: hypothetical protein VNA27_05730 [Rubrobacteraceae bacterium]|nr:hypothetical protein [Rubrobacteraceae bacterium]